MPPPGQQRIDVAHFPSSIDHHSRSRDPIARSLPHSLPLCTTCRLMRIIRDVILAAACPFALILDVPDFGSPVALTLTFGFEPFGMAAEFVSDFHSAHLEVRLRRVVC